MDGIALILDDHAILIPSRWLSLHGEVPTLAAAAAPLGAVFHVVFPTGRFYFGVDHTKSTESILSFKFSESTLTCS